MENKIFMTPKSAYLSIITPKTVLIYVYMHIKGGRTFHQGEDGPGVNRNIWMVEVLIMVSGFLVLLPLIVLLRIIVTVL